MHDVETVHVVKGFGELLDDGGGRFFSELMLAFNHIEQVSSSNQFHNDIVASCILHKFENTCDVRMLGLFEDGELVLVQLLVDLSDLEAALADDFDGARHS